MKTTISKIIAVLFLATLTTSCIVDGFNRVTGNRNVTVEKRKIHDDFTKVKVSTGLDVYITQGEDVRLTVEADENLHDIIITEVDNGVLRIYSEKNIWRAKARKVYLTTKSLESIKATSGSDVISENTLKSDNIEVITTSGADMKLYINANTIISKSTSGSDLQLIGTADNYNASATSGSSTDSYRLESKNVTVKATSGADINVHAKESIDARASSGGDVDYKGSPKQINKKSSSGGSVSAH